MQGFMLVNALSLCSLRLLSAPKMHSKIFFLLPCNCVAARLVFAYVAVDADTCPEFCEI